MFDFGLGKLKKLWRAKQLWGQVQEIHKEVTMSKNFLTSKTFWFNLLTFAATLAGMVPEEYQAFSLPALAAINIGLRAVTNKPLNLFGGQ